MKLLAFSVYDEKVQGFNAPFFCQAVGQASRSFDDLVNDPQTVISRHPEDYSLYQVGSFEDASAELRSEVPPVLVGRGGDYVHRELGGHVPARPDFREVKR